MDLTPDPILIQIGPLPLYWYGICYALGLFAAYQVIVGEARRHYLDAGLVANGIIVVAVAALIGGRLYHVIDQWDLYKDDLATIVLPPYTGLGVYGGIVLGTVVGILYIRWLHQPLGRWLDVIAPGLFVMQAIGRWGNFFNQELYGPPTDLPWGIPIDCAHRVEPYLCPPAGATALDATFHPLFLYESISGLLGALFLIWLGRRFTHRTRPGDLFLIFFIWYATVRLALETLRVGNWAIGDIPVASMISIVLIGGAVVLLVGRHLRPGPTTADIEAPLRDVAERPTFLYRVARRGFAIVGRGLFGFRLELEGAENLPRALDGRPAGGYVAVGLPHRTWVEPLVALELLPVEPRLVFFGDGRAIFRSRLRSAFVRRMGGVIPIWKPGSTVGDDREDREGAIETYVSATDRALRAGTIVIIFAETGPPVPVGQARPLGRGAVLLALRTGAPIVPIVFGGTDVLYRGRRIVMRVLPAVTVLDLAGASAGALPEPWSPEERRVTRAATAALHALCAPDVADVHRRAKPTPGTRRRWLWLTHLWR